MQTIVVILVAFVREIVLSRATLQLENIALRQQVAVLKRERPRPWLRPLDRVFWVFLSRLWPRWKDSLVIVKPETVIGWHRQGFRLFWKWKSCHGKPGEWREGTSPSRSRRTGREPLDSSGSHHSAVAFKTRQWANSQG